MFFTSHRKRFRSRASATRRFRPQADPLEDRCLLSVLLQDNFNNNSLDPGVWRVALPNIPGTPSVTEVNQHIELVDRGHLVTQEQFDPLAVGPLVIEGNWTFATGDYVYQQEDRMQIVTRTDGIPTGPPYGELSNGIAFDASMLTDGDTSYMWISDYSAGGVTLAKVPMDLHNGDTFHFKIRDDGQHLEFTIQPDRGVATTITASSATRNDKNYIDFYNADRQSNPAPKVSYLDDVVVTGSPRSDLVATDPAWNTTAGGVDFGYTISGADLPHPPAVALYWASGTTADTAIGSPIATPAATQTAQGASQSFHVSPAQLGPAPPGARYLLDVVNPPGANHIPESDESNGSDPNDTASLDTRPTLAPIADRTVIAGQSLTLTLQGSDPNGLSLTYAARVDSLAYHLKSTFSLYSNGNFYTNAYHGGEQWVQGPGGAWYYILTSGAFYKWSGVSGQLTGSFVAQLDPSYNANPSLLVNAQPGQGQARVSISGAQVTITPNSGFAGQLFVTATASNGYNTASQAFRLTVVAPPTLAPIADQTVAAGQSLTLTVRGSDPAGLPLTYSAVVDSLAYHLKSTLDLYSTGNYFTNWGGGGEQWVQGAGGLWYYILPSGAFYQWSGSRLTGTLVAQLDPSYNAHPALLVNAQPGHLASTLGLYSNGNFYTNVYGGGEQWVQGNGRVWYYILPSGAFYKWSGVSGQLTGTLVAQLDPSYNTNPSLLINAQTGQDPATVSLSGSMLTITPNSGFTGMFYVTAIVSNGYLSASQTFKVTVTS
jgi:hypothetical protein